LLRLLVLLLGEVLLLPEVVVMLLVLQRLQHQQPFFR
jgi:hypothetical protein